MHANIDLTSYQSELDLLGLTFITNDDDIVLDRQGKSYIITNQKKNNQPPMSDKYQAEALKNALHVSNKFPNAHAQHYFENWKKKKKCI
ncbi:hypothetical protein QJS04_geneDACA022821 [Acorus gramineus]|uniref:Uncharacterized protein n=1 Tax=Acorus gramineus TaxID=55184 RepID=A0AAV9BQ24_ACOGR|nr:hypothetical protein QJS04_geneDACA022821 [Acorus gramineus]